MPLHQQYSRHRTSYRASPARRTRDCGISRHHGNDDVPGEAYRVRPASTAGREKGLYGPSVAPDAVQHAVSGKPY